MYKGKRIIKSKLLFALPLMHNINPHIKVDDIPNYIIIMKMKNKTKDNKNYIMAYYSDMRLK